MLLRGQSPGGRFMANLNKVMLIGRLTRDPEIKEFDNGGKVANIGFAVNNRRKNPDSGEWEDVPVWVDLKAFDRENGRKLADVAQRYLRKGQQVYVEGHLVLEEWNDKENGTRRTKTVVYADQLQFLEKKKDAEDEPAAPRKSAKGKKPMEIAF
ncbi:MAG: single-stranded DNA-binding protein [Elusimicrobia bacterium CG_4_9_14_3_um_filter_62_55]|nr:MAG: single-stranded DNA-binding protein [Elusimicrobia bacterium CG_4_10_14_0_2_um_filter_63_34]PJB26596.1 MAG: single-stranded DNA-binding protein [Elusimicrobia bacterium CG_4_9_14_3_um_filter_62_55]